MGTNISKPEINKIHSYFRAPSRPEMGSGSAIKPQTTTTAVPCVRLRISRFRMCG